MTVETRVCRVRRVPAGIALGYGGRFVTVACRRVRGAPIGYHDGLRAVLLGTRLGSVAGEESARGGRQ